MNEKTIQFSAQIVKASANQDRTIQIKLDTQELPAEEVAQILSLFNRQIWVVMAETAITQSDLKIPEVIEEMDSKTPSQRLRDRMWVSFSKRGGKKGEFDSWYKGQLDKIGLNYLEKAE